MMTDGLVFHLSSSTGYFSASQLRDLATFLKTQGIPAIYIRHKREVVWVNDGHIQRVDENMSALADRIDVSRSGRVNVIGKA